MPLKIKLQRRGTKKRPFYRVVIQNATEKLGGAVVDVLGQYEPLKEPSLFSVDPEKTKDWLKKGATPTDRVRILLGKAGIMPPVDLAALPKRKPKAEQPKAEEEKKPEEKKEEKPKEEKKEEAKAEEKKEEPK